jgi:hypothetical protein
MMNPEIMTVKIGRRGLRDLTLYPLSLADEKKLSRMLKEATGNFFKQEDQSPMGFITYVTETITENLPKILSLIALDEDKTEPLLKDITNAQMAQIASAIYDANFGVIPKNLGSLSEKMKEMFPSLSGRQSVPSANDMVESALKTSPESLGKTEEAPVLN